MTDDPTGSESMAIDGEITTFIAALGHGTESEEVARAFALAAPDELERPTRQGGHTYEQRFARKAGVSYKFKDGELIRVVIYFVPKRRYTPYARPDEVLVGMTPSSKPERMREILGTPSVSNELGDHFPMAKGVIAVKYGAVGVDTIMPMISAD